MAARESRAVQLHSRRISLLPSSGRKIKCFPAQHHFRRIHLLPSSGSEIKCFPAQHHFRRIPLLPSSGSEIKCFPAQHHLRRKSLLPSSDSHYKSHGERMNRRRQPDGMQLVLNVCIYIPTYPMHPFLRGICFCLDGIPVWTTDQPEDNESHCRNGQMKQSLMVFCARRPHRSMRALQSDGQAVMDVCVSDARTLMEPQGTTVCSLTNSRCDVNWYRLSVPIAGAGC